MNMKCVCGECKYCRNHARYMSEIDLRRARSKSREIAKKYRESEIESSIIEFTSGRMRLSEFESVLDEGTSDDSS